MKFGVGQSVARKEDLRFLKGEGRYVDDIRLPGQAVGYVLRSPVAHARVRRMDLSAAQAAPGVLLVWSADSPEAAALADLLPVVLPKQPDGSRMPVVPQPHLARERVRYVGEPVAFVVAETLHQARDAAELIEVDYDELPVVIDGEAALAADAPLLHEDRPGNLAYRWHVGDERATDAALAGAAHRVALRIRHPRMIVAAMEPRAINAAYDAEDDRWTCYVTTQGSHSMRDTIADALQVDAQKVRVVTPDVGGGFGMKLMPHPEYGLTAAAAKALGRPVRWTADRSESFLSDSQGRDVLTDAQAGFDAEGRMVALRLDSISNLGAYPHYCGAGVHSVFGGDLVSTVYQVRNVYNHVRGVYTATTPTDAYRGAGRPEQNYIMERVMDHAAHALGMDQAELRRRNLIQPAQMPYAMPTGVTFDSGDFPRNLEDALIRADVAGFAARRAEAEARGKIAGIGVICYMERTGGDPTENARIELLGEGKVRIWAGTQSTGQGHETAYAQLVHQRLGVPFDSIEMLAGDSDALPSGGGTGGSRSLIYASAAFDSAANDVIKIARNRAAELLEAAEADIEFDAEGGGLLRVVGTDRSASLFDCAAAAPLLGVGATSGGMTSFPNGAHVAEVEIDPETGDLSVTRYAIVDDFGFVLSPMLVEGQVLGGVMQGIGEALCEEAVYDPETGQPLTGSYMDYRMPRAADAPPMTFSFNTVLSKNHPMGVKGCGEAGTVASAQAVIAAALDAMRPLGVETVDIPLSPQKLWRAMRDARGA